jgi:hypothetical protein
MRFKRLYALLIPVFMVSLLVIPAIPSARATGPAEIVRTFAPTANTTAADGAVYNLNGAMKLDSDPIALMDEGAWVSTAFFQNPNYVNYWAPYGNRSNFAPSNATILGVSIIAIVWCQIPRSFSFDFNLWNGTGNTHMYGGAHTAQMTATLYSYNVTALYPWNAANIVLSPPNTLVASITIGGTAVKAVYVDYIGVDYIWTNSTTSGGDDPETNFSINSIGVIGLMGMTGFIGMIGVPAASIWMFRRDGGSKIYIGVMALAAFTFCFGLFLASINGG